MFSKKTLAIVGLIILIAVSITVLSLPARPTSKKIGVNGLGLDIIGPVQNALAGSVRYVREVYNKYVSLIHAAEENEQLRISLSRSIEENNRYREAALANERLRQLLELKDTLPHKMIAAEVIGKDPSPWFKIIIIDKGKRQGIHAAMPVVVSEGIVGQVIESTGEYSKVQLLTDQNSAVDSIVQRTRARGIVKGGTGEKCLFDYALRKDDIKVGDIVVSSGVDGVFPKGLRVGQVAEIVKRNVGIFQDVIITSSLDFEKIEEVFIIVNSSPNDG